MALWALIGAWFGAWGGRDVAMAIGQPIAVGMAVGACIGSVAVIGCRQYGAGYVLRWAGQSVDHMAWKLAGCALGLGFAILCYPICAGFGVPWVGALGSLVCAVVGMRTVYSKRHEIVRMWGRRCADERIIRGCIVLDTSVIIDGRIAALCKTGFIEGTLVVPVCVLEELQHIADSADVLKRNRGRRGLDALHVIQKDENVTVHIHEEHIRDAVEVDRKLILLAQQLDAKVMTNDFNLNKVCALHGVRVLNINDLANAIKPVVLPGEPLVIHVIKEGKEHGQGIAYLDDGTMIVVENGKECLGARIDVTVTSVLQTSAGRMIFARPKTLEKAQ
jgi:uncharacterized protein YacL